MNETEPLLGLACVHSQTEPRSTIQLPTVDFDSAGDAENPLDWSRAYKQGVVLLLAFMAFTVTFACIGIVPVAEQIVFDLEGKESKSASIILVTVWELGEAAGPLLIAPLSEIYGRYPVFNTVNVVFIFGLVLAATSQSTNLLVFSRFLTGLAVASNVLNPSIVGDMYPSESRGSAMSLIMLAPLLGGAIGPAISGAIAETLGWRTILWISALLATICEVCFFVLLRETYKVPILQRRAARLRKELQDDSFRCAWEVDSGDPTVSWWSALRASITRPITVMIDSVVLQLFTFYGGLVFSFYYILATTFPGILKETYGFSPTEIGSSFLSFSFGATGGIIICNKFLDSLYINMGKSRGGVAHPEFRLPFMIGGAIVMPLIIALYGWTPYVHWPVYFLFLAVSALGFVMMMIWVPLASYLVDAFGLYSASAMTMVLLARCLGGTLLPLAIPALTDALGFGYGFVVLAGVCLVVIPIPIVVMRFGYRWRQKSLYTMVE